jgi:ariadne-1
LGSGRWSQWGTLPLHSESLTPGALSPNRGPPHAPATCAHAAAWRLKCADGSETVTWVAAHTKPCPKCGKSIEKAGGCNLVQCVCGTCICWLCGAQTGREHTWTTIAEHTCGRWRQDMETAAAAAAAQLHRWLHFHGRHEAQRHSAELEAKTLAAAMARIEELESGTFVVSRAAAGGAAAEADVIYDWAFVTAGGRQLAITRRVLACCAMFSFFFFAPRPAAAAAAAEEGEGEASGAAAPPPLPLTGPQSCSLCEWSETEVTLRANLFDDHRESLEATAEQLSQALAVSPELMSSETRARVVNLTALCGTRCANLYDIVENDLLGELKGVTAHIAAYRPRGLQQMRHLMAQQAHREESQWEDGTSAGTAGAHAPTAAGAAKRKRKPRHGAAGDADAAMAVDD